MGEGRGGAGRDWAGDGGGAGEVDDVELAIGAGGGDGATVGGEARIDPAAAGEGGDGEVGAGDEVELAGEGDEEAGAVGGKLILGETAEALAGALAAGLFFGAEFFLGALKQPVGREELALATGGEVEFPEEERGVAGAGAEEDDGAAVGREARSDGAAEGVVARLGEVAEVGEGGVGRRGGGCPRRERDERRKDDEETGGEAAETEGSRGPGERLGHAGQMRPGRVKSSAGAAGGRPWGGRDRR